MSVALFMYTLFMIFLFLWIKDKPSKRNQRLLLTPSLPPSMHRHTAILGPISASSDSRSARRHSNQSSFPTPIPVDGPGIDSMAEKKMFLPSRKGLPRIPEVSPNPAPVSTASSATESRNQPDIRDLTKMSGRELSAMLTKDPGLNYASTPPLPTGNELGAFPNPDMFKD